MCPRVKDSLILAALAAALLGGAGCPRGERSGPERPAAGPAAERRSGASPEPLRAGTAGSGVNGEPGTGGSDGGAQLVLTPARLEAYMAYQARMLEVWRRMLATPSGKPQLESLLAHARAEAEARAASGFSEEELGRLDALVSEVLARRAAARTNEAEKGLEQLAQLQKLQYQLPAEQQEALARSIAEVKRDQETQAALTEERQRYGSANVDLVLSKETQLAAAWERFLSLVGGREPGRGPKSGGKR